MERNPATLIFGLLRMWLEDEMCATRSSRFGEGICSEEFLLVNSSMGAVFSLESRSVDCALRHCVESLEVA
jgi:hypothetical protein